MGRKYEQLSLEDRCTIARLRGMTVDNARNQFRTHFSKCCATATSVPSWLVIRISAVARSFAGSIATMR
jgi:hypothetical protein